ncbi:MAG: hypothetical protein HY397_02400 [Candidatus Doudnabacteria bacterium]|nr:hypothetical protein [Candidatus Doudnabacteria bacterium]
MKIVLDGNIKNADVNIVEHDSIKHTETLFFTLYFAKILWHLTEDEVIRLKANLLAIKNGNQRLIAELEGTSVSKVKFEIGLENDTYKFKFTNWLNPDIHTKVVALCRFYLWLTKSEQAKEPETDLIDKVIEHTIFGYLQIGGQTMSKHVFVDIPEKVTISNTSSDSSISQIAFAQLVDTLCVKDTGK